MRSVSSASYADDDYTEGVWRMETIYEFGKPFADKRKPIMILDEGENPVEERFSRDQEERCLAGVYRL